MARKPRRLQWTDAACYHIINRGHNRETVFRDDDDRRGFVDLLDRRRERFGLRIYHYCLMSNHFHLLLQLSDARRLSKFMAGLLRSYVHYYNRRYRFVGHLWQGRFKSPAIEMENYLLSCGRYIERNPVEAGLVVEPWDYEWSSCRAYALGESNGLLADNACYEELAKTARTRQKRWREFLTSEDEKEAVIRKSDWVLGEPSFHREAQEKQGRPQGRARGRPVKRA